MVSDQTSTAPFMDPREEALFAQLYNRHYRPIHDFCRRRVTSDLVDDAVSETFLTAWRRLDDVPTGDEALVWLYRVAYRGVGHQWRSTARRQRLEDRLRSVVHRPASAADDSIVDGHEHHLVLAAAARLNNTDVEVLRLVAWEQLSFADIAALLEIEPNAVRQRLQRAKQNLAREYCRLETHQTSTPGAPTGGGR